MSLFGRDSRVFSYQTTRISHRLTGWNAVKSRVEQLGLALTDDEVSVLFDPVVSVPSADWFFTSVTIAASFTSADHPHLFVWHPGIRLRM